MKPMKKCRFSISNTCATNEKIASIEYCRRYNAESLINPLVQLGKVCNNKDKWLLV